MATPQWLPGVLIGGGALAAVYMLMKGGGGGSRPIVSNALIPTATPVQTPSRDIARVEAFNTLGNVALGSQRLTEQSKSIAAQLELGRFRLQEQSALVGASLEATKAGQQSQLELERIRQLGAQNRLNAEIADRQYDRDLQQRALDQTYALAQQGQIGQGLGSLLGAILRAMRPQGGAGGGAGGGTGSPQYPAPPGATRSRYPRIPVPNIGPFTPPFVPDWPSVNFPGFDYPDYGGGPVMMGGLPYGALPNPLDYYTPAPYVAPPLPESGLPDITYPDNEGWDWWDNWSDNFDFFAGGGGGDAFYPEFDFSS